MIAVQPEERAIEQEVRNLVASIVEDERAPVGVLALPRVRVLVQVGAVEVAEPVRVTREVRGHPVEDHADTATVELVHEGHELPWAAVTTRRGEVADGLIAPRAVKRMFHDRQELDVGEAHLADIVRELVGQLAIVEEAIALLGHTPPRAEMHFVDRQRLAEQGASGPLGEPGLVAPPEVVEVRYDRRGARRLRLEGERIGV